MYYLPQLNIGKQESVSIFPINEYRQCASSTELWFYDLDGNLLDTLKHRKIVDDTGKVLDYDAFLEMTIEVVIDLNDPEIYDYLRELKEIQSEIITIKSFHATVLHREII